MSCRPSRRNILGLADTLVVPLPPLHNLQYIIQRNQSLSPHHRPPKRGLGRGSAPGASSYIIEMIAECTDNGRIRGPPWCDFGTRRTQRLRLSQRRQLGAFVRRNYISLSRCETDLPSPMPRQARPTALQRRQALPTGDPTIALLAALVAHRLAAGRMSTPDQRCIGWPE
jgi:hypothetical protein